MDPAGFNGSDIFFKKRNVCETPLTIFSGRAQTLQITPIATYLHLRKETQISCFFHTKMLLFFVFFNEMHLTVKVIQYNVKICKMKTAKIPKKDIFFIFYV